MKKHAQPLSKHPVIRILIIWIFAALGLLFISWLQRYVEFDSIGTAFVAAAVIGLLNALLWPFLSRVLLPSAVFTGRLPDTALFVSPD